MTEREALRTAEAWLAEQDAPRIQRPTSPTPRRVWLHIAAFVALVAFFGWLATAALAKAAYDVTHAQEHFQ